VLYPVEFTVYDARVCEELPEFRKLAEKSFSNAMWEQYQHFKKAVEESTPSELCLRDKDRYLWGKSFYKAAVEASADAPRGTDRSIPVGEHATRSVIRQQIYDVVSAKFSSIAFSREDLICEIKNMLGTEPNHRSIIPSDYLCRDALKADPSNDGNRGNFSTYPRFLERVGRGRYRFVGWDGLAKGSISAPVTRKSTTG
jgi:hypothetical protein